MFLRAIEQVFNAGAGGEPKQCHISGCEPDVLPHSMIVIVLKILAVVISIVEAYGTSTDGVESSKRSQLVGGALFCSFL